jgi:hypothetical protein
MLPGLYRSESGLSDVTRRTLLISCIAGSSLLALMGCNPSSPEQSPPAATSPGSGPVQTATSPLLPAGVRNLAATPHDGRFPIGALTRERAQSDSFVRGWYGDHLTALGEPRLGTFVDSVDTDAVRFLYLRSFHHPISVRAMRRGATYALIGVELDGAGGYEPGNVLRRDSATIDSGVWMWLTRLLSDARTWDSRNPDELGLDGAEWIIEAASGGKLYAIDQWSPLEFGPHENVRAFGVGMLRAAKLAREPIY